MKRFLFLLSLVVLAIAGTSQLAFAQLNEAEVRPGQLLIQPKPGYNINTIYREVLQQQGDAAELHIMREVSRPMRVWQIGFNENVISNKTMLAAWKTHPGVAIAQENHVTKQRATVPNDPEYSNQWQYDNTGANGGVLDADIDAPEAWDLVTGGVTPLGDTIVVCIVDDGIDLGHPDMIDNLWRNHAEIPGNGIDDDNNGYVDDFLGWNADDNNDIVGGGGFVGGHGTPVAGIVGAKGDNGIGVAGVNWNVDLMIVLGGGDEAQAIAAYSYPLTMRKMYNQSGGAQGAFVVATNSSWGTDFGQPANAPLWCAFYDSLGAEGIISCGATINGNQDVDVVGDLPTACPSPYLISVTNMNRTDTKVTGAGYGTTTIDLGAFGEDTWTAEEGGGYGGFGGTSGATPHVAGAVALLYAAPCPTFNLFALSQPDSAAMVVKNAILNSVDANASLAGITVTGGRLNLYQSVLELLNYGCGDSTTCFPAYALETDNVSDVAAVLQWNQLGSGAATVRYRPVGTATWTTLNNIINNSLGINGLSACTDYEFQVDVACDSLTAGFSSLHAFRTDGCCVSPAGVSATLVNHTTIDITWGSVLAAASYNLRYREQGTGTWTTLSGLTGTSNTISALDSCTSYEYQVQTLCDTGAAPFSASHVIMTEGCRGCLSPFCASQGNNASDEWIDRVQLNTLDHVSGSDGGYGDFTGTPTTILHRDSSYTVTVTPGYDGFNFNESFAVFIDFNLDGDFDDANEEVLNAAGNVAVNATFLVPATADTGITRMRVKMTFDNSLDPCEAQFDYGEVEDYCIRLVDSLPGVVDTIPDGIGGPPAAGFVRVFPNPAAGLFNVRLSGLDATARLEVSDVLGHVVLQSSTKQTTAQLDLSGKPAGIYLLKVTSGNQVLVKRLVVR